VTAAISSNAETERAGGAAYRRRLAARRAGFTAGHVAPEAFVGGPIAAVREGDIIHFDVAKRTLDVEISKERDGGAAQELQAAGAALAEGRVSQVRGSCDFGV